MRIARFTGVMSGVLIALLGLWGALIPFVGPSFNYSFGVNETWHYSSDRLWLSILPGAVALVGGLLIAARGSLSRRRLGGMLAVAAGVWFVVGPPLSMLWERHAGPIGPPLFGATRQGLELLGYFYGLGAVIVALAARVSGRLAPVRTPAQPAPEAVTTPAPRRFGRAGHPHTA